MASYSDAGTKHSQINYLFFFVFKDSVASGSRSFWGHIVDLCIKGPRLSGKSGK